MSETDEYREGYKEGYKAGFSDGTGAGYSDAKHRAYLAIKTVRDANERARPTVTAVEGAMRALVGEEK